MHFERHPDSVVKSCHSDVVCIGNEESIQPGLPVPAIAGVVVAAIIVVVVVVVVIRRRRRLVKTRKFK